jgi:hypothetical protein
VDGEFLHGVVSLYNFKAKQGKRLTILLNHFSYLKTINTDKLWGNSPLEAVCIGSACKVEENRLPRRSQKRAHAPLVGCAGPLL